MQRITAFVGAIVAAIAALAYILIGARHQRRQQRRTRAIKAIEQDRQWLAEQAAMERADAAEDMVKAEHALQRGRDRIKQIRDSGHETLADSIDAYNRRVRDD